MNRRKAALIVALAFLFEAFIAPAYEKKFFEALRAEPEKSTLSRVADILRQNRTGLGSMEELRLAQVILQESIKHNMDPLFVLALIETESGYYNWSKSFNGAVGLMQILPATGEEIASELNMKWRGEITLLNPYVNVRMGVHYLAALMDRFDDPKASLIAYNAGPNYMASRLKAGGGTEGSFPERVFENYRDIKERAGVN